MPRAPTLRARTHAPATQAIKVTALHAQTSMSAQAILALTTQPAPIRPVRTPALVRQATDSTRLPILATISTNAPKTLITAVPSRFVWTNPERSCVPAASATKETA